MHAEQSYENRRQYVRISFRAYGFNHHCEVLSGQNTSSVELIDLSPHGARLKITGHSKLPSPLTPFETCHVRLRLEGLDLPQPPVAAEIRWIHDQEFGVKFHTPLDATVGELQRLLDR